MLRRRRDLETATQRDSAPPDRFHEWVLSLPWVVERPYDAETPGLRCFAIDCEPLGRRQVWLISGLQSDSDPAETGVAVIVPAEAALSIEDIGWGRMVAMLSADHVLVALNCRSADLRQTLEALVFTAYGHAMSGSVRDV
jgi:hypothetical protein